MTERHSAAGATRVLTCACAGVLIPASKLGVTHHNERLRAACCSPVSSCRIRGRGRSVCRMSEWKQTRRCGAVERCAVPCCAPAS